MTIRPRSRACYVTVVGRIDNSVHSPVEIVNSTREAELKLIILDLSESSRLDTGGVEWIEQLSALADCHRIRVRVVAKRGSAMYRLLDLLHVNRFLIVVHSIWDALRFDRAK